MKSFALHSPRTLAAAVLLALASMAAVPAIAAPGDATARSEARIESMHAKLRITAAQEDQWKAVAQVMRDNQAAMEPLIMERKKNAANMTAVDDLKSYADITEAHLQGVRRFNPVFGTLYAGMSDPQKKEADGLFRRGPGKKMAPAK
jgi:protein CpxP